MSTAERSLTPTLVGFGRALRNRGLSVGPGQAIRFQTAVAALDASSLEDLYWAGLACFTTAEEDQAVYDDVFSQYFLGLRDDAGDTDHQAGAQPERRPQGGAAAPSPGGGRSLPVEQLAVASEEGEEIEERSVGAVASPVEILRTKAFPDCTPEELARLAELMRMLRVRIPPRRSRRTRPGPSGRYLDLRRTLRRSLRTHGEVVHRSWRRRKTRPRSLILLLDVSGSMAEYSRALLQFAYSLSGASQRVEVFCFGTRLTRITASLRDRDPDAALAHAAASVVDWDGGTTIGRCLREFLRRWGRRGWVRGSITLICSDGLERGDPTVLAAQMAGLARLTDRLVWVNPLKGDPQYEPIARGMRAALPHIDHLVAGDSLASLEALARLLRDPSKLC